jgi:hypothetical protein
MWFGIRARLDPYIKTIEGLFHKDTWQELEECDVLLVRHDNNCGYVYNEKAYAHLIDSLGDHFTKKGLVVRTVAKPHSRILSDDAFFKPVSYRYSHSLITVSGYLRKILQGIQKGEKWILKERVKLWGDILKLSKTGCVIGIQPDESLCRACREIDIPVYDLQHGVISDDHPWYGEEYRIETPTEMLPTGFLCWDDHTVATLSKWALPKGIRVVKLGNPWFLRFIKNDPDVQLVKEAILTSGIQPHSKPTILISLQWGLKDHFQDVPNGIMVKALELVILDAFNTYNWMLRLHPVQLRDKNEMELARSYLISTFGAEITNIWINDSFLPLPLTLRKADLHITYASTIVIEAAWGGIRSGILNTRIMDTDVFGSYYVYERSLGIAEVLPHDPEIIKQWIEDTLAKGRAEPTMDTTGKELDAFVNEIVERCKNRNHK